MTEFSHPSAAQSRWPCHPADRIVQTSDFHTGMTAHSGFSVFPVIESNLLIAVLPSTNAVASNAFSYQGRENPALWNFFEARNLIGGAIHDTVIFDLPLTIYPCHDREKPSMKTPMALTDTIETPLSVELAKELENLRKLSLNLLMAFLTVHAISASRALAVMTLALLVYTINLHIAINNRYLQSGPTLCRFLHAVPLLGVFSMAVFRLVAIVQSPAIAAGVLLVCALPLFAIAVRFVKRYTGVNLMPVPVQMRMGTVARGSTEGRVISS